MNKTGQDSDDSMREALATVAEDQPDPPAAADSDEEAAVLELLRQRLSD